ncbi:hypothetical protein BC941DRAFT_421446 [Chlamydoabsidia padenii]|nr:hypothetical protein BC941DRAFT_421446 [Chlamydoabsidia padenii]
MNPNIIVQSFLLLYLFFSSYDMSLPSKKKKTKGKKSSYPSKLDPTMIPSQNDINLVRCSWERVIEIHHPSDEDGVSPAQAFGLAFYDALFHLDPQVQQLFCGTNVLTQAKMLTFVIGCLVRAPMIAPHHERLTIKEINAQKHQDNGDERWLVNKITELGARHHFYHVDPCHFQLVGPAVDVALRARLQHEYNDAIGYAWIKTHAFVAHHMAHGLLAQRQWEKRKSLVRRFSCTIQ